MIWFRGGFRCAVSCFYPVSSARASFFTPRVCNAFPPVGVVFLPPRRGRASRVLVASPPARGKPSRARSAAERSRPLMADKRVIYWRPTARDARAGWLADSLRSPPYLSRRGAVYAPAHKTPPRGGASTARTERPQAAELDNGLPPKGAPDARGGGYRFYGGEPKAARIAEPRDTRGRVGGTPPGAPGKGGDGQRNLSWSISSRRRARREPPLSGGESLTRPLFFALLRQKTRKNAFLTLQKGGFCRRKGQKRAQKQANTPKNRPQKLGSLFFCPDF